MNQFEHISDEKIQGKIGIYEGKKVKVCYKMSDYLGIILLQGTKNNVELVPSEEVELLGVRKGQIKYSKAGLNM